MQLEDIGDDSGFEDIRNWKRGRLILLDSFEA